MALMTAAEKGFEAAFEKHFGWQTEENQRYIKANLDAQIQSGDNKGVTFRQLMSGIEQPPVAADGEDDAGVGDQDREADDPPAEDEKSELDKIIEALGGIGTDLAAQLKTALETMSADIEVVGGIKERELLESTAARLAEQTYLRSRLNFEKESDARAKALQAAGLAIQAWDMQKQAQFQSAQFAMEARGPRNYAQLFNLYSGQPAMAGGVPERLLQTITGTGRVAPTPTLGEIPPDLGFGSALRGALAPGAPPAGVAAFTPGAPGAMGVPAAGTQPTLPAFNPFNVNPQSYARLMPSEQQALLSIGESAGFPGQDILAALQSNLPSAFPVSRARTGTAGLRL